MIPRNQVNLRQKYLHIYVDCHAIHYNLALESAQISIKRWIIKKMFSSTVNKNGITPVICRKLKVNLNFTMLSDISHTQATITHFVSHVKSKYFYYKYIYEYIEKVKIYILIIYKSYTYICRRGAIWKTKENLQEKGGG